VQRISLQGLDETLLVLMKMVILVVSASGYSRISFTRNICNTFTLCSYDEV